MSSGISHILVIEAVASMAQAYVSALRRDGHDVAIVADVAQAAGQLGGRPADLVLFNVPPGDRTPADCVRRLREAGARRVIVLTAQGSVQLAVEVMRAGAADLLMLPVGTEKLRSAVATALAAPATGDAATAPSVDTPAPVETGRYFGFIGASPGMLAVYRLIENAAPSKATVFITGESGTGKEVCAEAIHRRSPRAKGPFVAINCAAIPKDLMESEIFGHVKGAFTGATTDHAGAALQAQGGTLFLDEICEMDLALQAKLLRFLQTGMVKKVGSERLEPVDVRIVCATNRDPFAEVQAGRFREDLFYRLQVISIELPPLRERGEDVLLIAGTFLETFTREEGKAFTGISPEAEDILRSYRWPGNVRQLLNVVRNVVVLNDGTTVQPFMLPPPLNKPTMIVPPMLADPRWAAMAGPLPFPFATAGPPAGGGAAAPTAPPAGHGIAGPFAAALGLPPRSGAGLPGTVVEIPDGDAAPPPPAGPMPSPAGPYGDHGRGRTEAERRIRPLWLVEEETIEEAIRLCGGNITRAAALLEINPCTIYRRRQRKRTA